MFDKPGIHLQANAFVGRGPSPEEAATNAVLHLRCWLDLHHIGAGEVQHVSTSQGTVQEEFDDSVITEHTFTIAILYLSAI